MNINFNKYKIILMFLFVLTLISFLMTPDTLSKYTETFGKTLTLNIQSNMASYTINATPSDSEIYLSVNGGAKTKVENGSKIYVNKGSTVTYEVSKFRYYTSTKSTTVNSATIENVSLELDPNRKFTIKPNKPNQVTQCLTLKPAPEGTPEGNLIYGKYVYDRNLFYTANYNIETGNYEATTADVKIDDLIICSVAVNGQCYKDNNSCQVDDFEASEYVGWVNSEPIVISNYADSLDGKEDNIIEVSVELEEKPWITTLATNNTTGAVTGTLINNHPGYYYVQLWGANGGHGYDKGGEGGEGGLMAGIVYIGNQEAISYVLGGNGQKGPTNKKDIAGGQLGGGTSNTSGKTYTGNGGSGGGVSWLYSDTNGKFLLISGAGGGGSGTTSINQKHGVGGNGGTNINTTYNTELNGTVMTYQTNSFTFNGYIYNGSDGTQYCYRKTGSDCDYMAYGGTATTGASDRGGTGSFLQGGDSLGRGGAGGSGFIGGGGGYSATGESNWNVSGGGGGSSFKDKNVNSTIPSDATSAYNTFLSSSQIYTNASDSHKNNMNNSTFKNPSFLTESTANTFQVGGAISIIFVGYKDPNL